MVDDYYINVLDWSAIGTLAVGLGPSVYLWNSETAETEERVRSPDVSSREAFIKRSPIRLTIADRPGSVRLRATCVLCAVDRGFGFRSVPARFQL